MRAQNCFPNISERKKVWEDLQMEVEIALIRNDKKMTDQEKRRAIAELRYRKLHRDLLERIIVY